MKPTLSAVLLASALGATLPAYAAGTGSYSAGAAAMPGSVPLMLAADSDADQNAAMPGNPRAREEVDAHRADVDHGDVDRGGEANRPDVDHDRAERPEVEGRDADVDRPDVDRPNVDRPEVDRPSIERPETDR